VSDSEQFPPPPLAFRAINAGLEPVKYRIARLDVDSVVATARKRTNLEDFGDEHFRETLAVLIDSLERDAALHAIGRLTARRQIVDLLSTKLRVRDLLERQPEILDAPVSRPIVILGMPRTGTTILQRVLAQDPSLRSLPYWEALFPLPDGDAAQRPQPNVPDWNAPDPRIAKARQSLKILHYAAPLMLSMHEMEAEAPDEEIWLLAVDFATMLFEASYRVPTFRDWYCAHDQLSGYHFLRTMLQVLQWYRPAERWLLKSPQHLEQLPALLEVFPDATIVQTHRDPLMVTASFCSMATYGRRMNSRHIDPNDIGTYWSARIERMLRRSVEDRPVENEHADGVRFVDVHFRELVDDPIAVVKRIYGVADHELTTEAETRMRRYLAANPRGKHGAHTYRLEDYGLDSAERRTAFDFYRRRFAVPIERA
jgi:hypothetical protein